VAILASAIVLLGAPEIVGAQSQNPEFTWDQCNGMSASACADLMTSMNLPVEKHEQTHFARASLLLQGRDLVGAIEEYRQVTRINPNSARGYKNLGFLEGFNKEWESAVEHLRRALELDANDPDLRPLLAVALAKSKDCEGASAALAKAEVLDPTAPRLAEAEELVGGLCQ
jgi:Flp pilus assembly protein TadD